MNRENLSPAVLRDLLRYEPDTGKLFWRYRPNAEKRWNTRFAGKEALTSARPNSYGEGRILKIGCYAHRVIWAMQTGNWPQNMIDHIDGNKANNKWSNLREADHSQNGKNRTSLNNSSSKFLGVSRCKNTQKWRATIRVLGSAKTIGYFDNEISAAKAYDAEAILHHGEYARPNFELVIQ